MNAEIIFKKNKNKKIVDLYYAASNSGVYSILKKDCVNHRIVTFQIGRVVCSIYVFDDGRVQPLEINCFNENSRFELLDETIEIRFI